MGKGVRIALYSALGLALAASGLTVGAVSYLRTDAGSAFVLAHLKTILQKNAGARLEYAHGSVFLFSGAHFEQLKVIQDQGGRHLALSIDHLDIEYDLSLAALWNRKVEIRKFEVMRPTVVLREVSGQGLSDPAAAPPSSEPSDLNVMRHWITDPPVQIVLKDLRVEHLKLDVDQKTPLTVLQASARDVSLHLAVNWIRDQLKIAGDLGLNEAIPIVWTQNTVELAQQKVQLRLGGSAQWGVNIHATSGVQSKAGWDYEVSPFQTRFEVQDFAYTLKNPATELTARAPRIRMESTSRFLARTTELFSPEPGALQIADTNTRLEFSALTLTQSQHLPGTTSQSSRPPLQLKLESQDLRVTSGLKAGSGFTLSAEYGGKGVFSPDFLNHSTNLDFKSVWHLPQDLKSLDSQSDLSLGGISLLTGKVQAALEPDSGKSGMGVTGKLRAVSDGRLIALLKSAAVLKQTGQLDSELSFKLKTDGVFATLFDAAQAAGRAPLHARAEWVATQQGGSARSPIRFEPMRMSAGIERDPAQDLTTLEFKGGIPSLMAAPLKRACSVDWTSRLEWQEKPRLLTGTAAVMLQKTEALSLHGKAELKPGVLQADAAFDLRIGSYLEGLLSARSLKGYGQWRLQGDLKIKNATDLFEENGSLAVSQVADADALAISLPSPAKLTHRIVIDHGKTDGEISGDLPLLEAREFGKMIGTHFSATARTSQAQLGEDLDIKAELRQADLVLAEVLAKKAPKLSGLSMTAQAQLRGGNQLELRSLNLSLGPSMFKFTATGSGKLRSEDFEARGVLSLDIPTDFPRFEGAAAHGVIQLPWTLSVVQGRELDLEGTAALENLSVETAQGGVSGVSGKVPFSERLVFDGKSIRFAHLIKQNPFERVDFERVRPLIEGADQVRLDQLHWEEKTYGPLVAYFSVRQNMVQAQQLNLNLGAGRISGEMFLDAHPANLQLGLLSRITGLDLGEVLPKKFLNKMPSGDKTVSGRSGIVVDLNKRTVDGRVDITQIGASQLNLMLNVMDPEFQDEKLNRLRGYLSAGYPEYVRMSLADGFMDMHIGMNVQGARFDEPIPGMSMSPWIASATADVMKKTQEGPLK